MLTGNRARPQPKTLGICQRISGRHPFHQMESRRIHETVNDEILLVYVQELRRHQPRIGTRKLYDMLQEVKLSNSIKIGRDKFFSLLRRNDLLVKRRRKHVKTTDSYHHYKKYPNLIEAYVSCGPEQILDSDITYLMTVNGFVYLSLVTDQYSKKIMGYHVHTTLETDGPLAALKMALKARYHLEARLIHHSDRGIQYCCDDYIRVLENNHIQISMSSKGNLYENAVAERVNGILKSEFYLDRIFNNLEQARSVVKEVVTVYNNQRPHASCNYLTPEQAHSQNGILKKRWKNYKPKDGPKDLQPIGEEVKKALEQLLLKDLPTNSGSLVHV